MKIKNLEAIVEILSHLAKFLPENLLCEFFEFFSTAWGNGPNPGESRTLKKQIDNKIF